MWPCCCRIYSAYFKDFLIFVGCRYSQASAPIRHPLWHVPPPSTQPWSSAQPVIPGYPHWCLWGHHNHHNLCFLFRTYRPLHLTLLYHLLRLQWSRDHINHPHNRCSLSRTDNLRHLFQLLYPLHLQCNHYILLVLYCHHIHHLLKHCFLSMVLIQIHQSLQAFQWHLNIPCHKGQQVNWEVWGRQAHWVHYHQI